ncbi:MAG: PAS domain S-box protein, partial [Desulfatitalea sp.]
MQRITTPMRGYAVHIAVAVLMAASLGIFLHGNRMEKQKSHFAQHQEALALSYRASIQMYRLAMDGFYHNTICRPEVIQLFAEGAQSTGKQRDVARGRLYRMLFDAYTSMQSQNLLQLHFHLSDGTSYLRFHKPDRYGDSLLAERNSVAVANAEQRQVYGFEIGKVRSGFRYVYPVSWEGRHIGSVEVSVTTKGIIAAMVELDPSHEHAFLLNRRLIDPYLFPEQRWLYTESGIHPQYVIEDAKAVLPESPPVLSANALTVNRRLQNDAMVQRAMTAGDALTTSKASGTGPQIISLLPVRDVVGRVAGYLITYEPDHITPSLRKEFFVYIATTTVAMGLIAVLLIGLQKRTASLGREERNLKVMNDTLAEGVYVMDTRGVITRINPSVTRMLGYTAEELIGRIAHDLFHVHADAQRIPLEECPLFNAISRGKAYDGEERFLRKDGSVIIVEVATRPIFKEKELMGSVTAFHDITKRKITEQALIKSEERARQLSTAVEQSPASIIITNTRGTIEYVNPKFVEKTGYTFHEAVGRNPSILQSGATPKETYAHLWRSITAGREWKGELHNRKKNGELYWESAAISPIRDNSGSITHFIA